jgi:hypothetical protein
MKVLPNGADAATPLAQLFQPASAPAEMSFASLLHVDDGLVVPAQPRQSLKAVEFSALGVFGRYGAQAENPAGTEISLEPGGDNKAAAKTGNKAAITRDDQGAATGDQNVAVTSTSLADTVHRAAVHRDITSVVPYAALPNTAGSPEPAEAAFAASAYEAGTTTTLAGSSVNQTAIRVIRDLAFADGEPVSGNLAAVGVESEQAAGVTEADGAPVTDGPAHEQRLETPQGNSDADVSVLGADSALNVIVRGNFLQEGNSPLREMVENTAAEFGMKVSGLRLNGVDAKSSATASGDQNGSNTR